MNIYELICEIVALRQTHHWDDLPFSFTQTNRAKLQDHFDLEVFDLLGKTYEIKIIYRSERRVTELVYRKGGDGELFSFADFELKVFESLDWTKMPHNLKAHVYDVVWLCNHKYEAAKIAVDEYFESYRDWFDKENWVSCVDYINRAVELASRIGIDDKKDAILTEVYNDVVRLNGDDPSFLSISLIELLMKQNFHCDFASLIPLVDRLISKNEGSIKTAHLTEKAYYVKADLYKKLKDTTSENKVYVHYADTLMEMAEKLVEPTNGEKPADSRNWFMAEADIKKAISLFQNHGASEKAGIAQKRLVETQKEAVKHIQMHEIKYDVSGYFKNFEAEYGNHNVHDLIWDIVFDIGFQNKQRIREDITKKSTPLLSMVPMQMLGTDGQTEFYLPALNLNDENNILLHMYNKARDCGKIIGQTAGVWFIQRFRKLDLKETDLDSIFMNNPIIPKGQEKDVQRGVYYGLTGHMSDALDKLAPKVENIIRNLAEMCGDLMTYYDTKEGIQQKKVLSQVYNGEKLNECVEENILFTFDGLLQQKAGSNIRNKTGHGLNTEAECSAGDCIYFVMIVLKFCAFYCDNFLDEYENRNSEGNNDST